MWILVGLGQICERPERRRKYMWILVGLVQICSRLQWMILHRSGTYYRLLNSMSRKRPKTKNHTVLPETYESDLVLLGGLDVASEDDM
jgi:hypothetical protein